MDYFKDHSSHIEKKVEKEVLGKMNNERMDEVSIRCANAKNKFQEILEMFKKVMDEAIALY